MADFASALWNKPASAGGGGSEAHDGASDPVTRSLRFDGSAYLSRSTGSTSTTWTLSFWVKRATISGPSQQQYFATWAISGSTGEGIAFRGTNDSSNLDKIGFWTGSAQHYSTAVYRDPAAWAHICISVNSGTATVYYNGESILSGISGIQAWGSMRLGAWLNQNELEGYIADVYGVESSALDHTSFTESNDYGGLKPKEYTGSFGTNGFHLLFENTSSIGEDDAGSNDFTATNLSSHDVMLDVPYPKNYATMNPVSRVVASGSNTFSEGNLRVYSSHADNKSASTIAVSSGKWYAEAQGISGSADLMLGIGKQADITNDGLYTGESGNYAYMIYCYDGRLQHNGNQGATGVGAVGDTDILQIALDLDNNKVWWGQNGTWVGTVGSSGGTTITSGEYFFLQGYRDTAQWNFGQDPTFSGTKTSGQDTSQSEFFYAPPTGFNSLNTSNLPSPTVTPSEHFNIALYNGNSSTNAVTGLGFQPDLLYTKSRSTSGSSPKWFDSLRGVTKRLETNTAGAETTQSSELSSFDSDGFTLGSGSGSNYSGRTYVGWNWKAHQGGPVTRSHTMTLEVDDLWGSGSDWGDTKLEVWEGATKLKEITQPAYIGGSSTTWTIKTNDTDKIKVVWDVDSSMDWTAMYAVLKNSSNTTLASWDGSSYGGGSTPADGSNFYIPSGHDSSNAAVTGVVESSSPTVESYNSAAGFTMIKYAGDGANDNDTQTLDHSLGVPLEFVIVKGRTNNDSMDSGEWVVWHKDLTSGNFLRLNSNAAQDSESSSNTLIATATSGSQHRVVVNNGYANTSGNAHYLNSGPDNGTGDDYILYGWAGVESYSKFGKYTGNGSSDGPFIYTGFRPAFVLIKNTGASQDWFIIDNKREGYNPVDKFLKTNSQNAEATASTNKADFTANGFKLRGSGSVTNQNNTSFVYACFSESPFSKSNAR